MLPTPSWPQSKGQIAECLVLSRTHYKGLETTGREQRSLCDTTGQRQTDMQDGGGGGGGKLVFAMIKGIKSTNKEQGREEEMRERERLVNEVTSSVRRVRLLTMLFSNVILFSNLLQRHRWHMRSGTTSICNHCAAHAQTNINSDCLSADKCTSTVNTACEACGLAFCITWSWS